MLKRFQSGSFEGATISSDSIEKECLLCYTGTFDSLDGEVTVTTEMLELIAQNHNAKMAKARLQGNGVAADKFCPPVQLDHSKDSTMTVGRVKSDLVVRPYITLEGQNVMGLYGFMTVIGVDNVEKVNDGRWTNLSIGADFEEGTIQELTITPFPAAAEASMLSKRLRNTIVARSNYKGKDIQILKGDEGCHVAYIEGKTYPVPAADAGEALKMAKQICEKNHLSKGKDMAKKKLMSHLDKHYEIKKDGNDFYYEIDGEAGGLTYKSHSEAEMAAKKAIETNSKKKLKKHIGGEMGKKLKKLSDEQMKEIEEKSKAHFKKLMEEAMGGEEGEGKKLSEEEEKEKSRLAEEEELNKKHLAEKEELKKKHLAEQEGKGKELSEEEKEEQKKLAEGGIHVDIDSHKDNEEDEGHELSEEEVKSKHFAEEADLKKKHLAEIEDIKNKKLAKEEEEKSKLSGKKDGEELSEGEEDDKEGKEKLGGADNKEKPSDEKEEGYISDRMKHFKHLTEVEKMAEGDAFKKIGEMSDEEVKSAHEVAMKKIEEGKKTAEPTADEIKDQDKAMHNAKMSKKMSDKIKNLSAAHKASMGQARLSLMKAKIGARLSSLKAMGKITPAEAKKLNIEKLAMEDAVTLEKILKNYDDREPVVHTGIVGTQKAIDIHHLSAKVKEMEAEQLEEETVANMPFLKNARLSKTKGNTEKTQAGAINPDSITSVQKTLVDLEQKGKMKEVVSLAHNSLEDMKRLAVGEREDAKRLGSQVVELEEQLAQMEKQYNDLLETMQG